MLLLPLLALAMCLACPAHSSLPNQLFGGPTCPPKNFNSVDGFDVQAWAAAPWYPQQQIPLIYQTNEDLYCVQAQYKLINASNPSAGVYVYNSARKGGVNGTRMGNTDSGVFALQAIPAPGADRASKLQVGPKALSSLGWVAYGPYWIVAVGNSTNSTLKYDWAIVSGGAPSYRSNGACSTFLPVVPTTWQYKGGLWFFTRKPVDQAGNNAAYAKAKGLGFDLSQLSTVTQAGCTYPPLI